ncbi:MULTISPECIES: cell division protein FtsA [Deinococcus]|nr:MULTISPECIES: cell division protein FtsA [Deinococcus]MCY1703047.1 cell division protein FtsA [Deinococcus sp. SL84]
MKDNRMIVGLDIGTTKITTVIGELAGDGSVDIIGQGSVPSEGLKRGSVVNLERTVQAIRESVHRAERVAGVKVESAYVSVAGNHTKAITSHGLAAIRRGHEITDTDVHRAIENAQAVPLDPNLEVLHTLPQEYEVDGQEGIKSPVGMHGVRLEVDVHIVAGTAGPLLNLRRCVQEAGLRVDGFVLQALASGLSTVDTGEQSQSVIVIDMGGGTTDIGVFRRGNLAHSASIPIGGDHVTADLAQILKIPMEEAEDVKRRYGAALPEMADADLTLEITTGQGKTHALSAQELSRVIKPRIAEIFGMIRDEIDQTLGPVELIAQHVILTGGASKLRGTPELARDRFRVPVRLGKPGNIGGLIDIVNGPEYAAGVGLVLFGLHEDGRLVAPAPTPLPEPEPEPQPSKPLLKSKKDREREPEPQPQPAPQRAERPQRTERPRPPEPQPAPQRAEVSAAPVQQTVVRTSPQAQEQHPPAPGHKPSLMEKLRSWFSDWL